MSKRRIPTVPMVVARQYRAEQPEQEVESEIARLTALEADNARLTIERDAYKQLWDQACARLSAIQDAVNGKHDVEVA